MKYDKFLDIIDEIHEVLFYTVITMLIFVPIISLLVGFVGLYSGEGYFYTAWYCAEYLIVSPAAWVGSLLGILYAKIFR